MSATKKTSGPNGPDELARMAIERSRLYGLLATIFRAEPTTVLLQHLLKPDFLNDLAAVGIDTDALTALKPAEALLTELKLEFSRLFFGPGKHVSPYESVHLGGAGGSLWGPETSAVKKFIEHAGFAYDANYHGLPDHISVELELMAHLTELEAEAWRNADTDKALNCLQFQKAFISGHLGRWVASFSDKVTELAETALYPQMAALTRDFVKSEFHELKDINHLKTRLENISPKIEN